MNYPPTLETKRQMLTQAREQFRAKGFEAEMNIEALKVQSDDGDDASDVIAQQQKLVHKFYASARRMDEMLAKLPKPKDEKKKS